MKKRPVEKRKERRWKLKKEGEIDENKKRNNGIGKSDFYQAKKERKDMMKKKKNR